MQPLNQFRIDIVKNFRIRLNISEKGKSFYLEYNMKSSWELFEIIEQTSIDNMIHFQCD